MTTFRACLKLFFFALFSLILVPLQMLVKLFHKGRGAYILPQLWHRLLCFCFGIRVVIHGTPCKTGRVVYVSNHLSHLDIPVIGTCLKASFVAKNDVQSWPVFGFLATLQQTVFINRSRSAAAQETDAIGSILDSGKNLIIFPEGTSTDGREVVPFKSSIFALMTREESRDFVIQPFTVSMTEVDGKPPNTQELRDLYSWHRDMDTELPTHFWLFAKSKGAVITLSFHTPIPAADHTDRKALAKICFEQVSKGLESESEAPRVKAHSFYSIL